MAKMTLVVEDTADGGLTFDSYVEGYVEPHTKALAFGVALEDEAKRIAGFNAEERICHFNAEGNQFSLSTEEVLNIPNGFGQFKALFDQYYAGCSFTLKGGV